MSKSRRAAALTCLQQGAQFMERYCTTNLSSLKSMAPTTCEGVGATFYDISGGTPTAKTSTLTATPTARQDDPLCGRLTINLRQVDHQTARWAHRHGYGVGQPGAVRVIQTRG
jgi:type IV pilus assembly protein PilE